MTACGMPQDWIAEQIINPSTQKPIDAKTLRKAFNDEIKNSLATANGHVAQALFKKAIGSGPQSVTAAIFWLKTRAGWVPREGVELTGKDGAPIQTNNEAGINEKDVRAIVERLRSEI